MKKLLLLLLVILSIALGYSYAKQKTSISPKADISRQKNILMRFAIVADSHSDNELLRRALEQAKGEGINFVVGLGDYTTIGTRAELSAAKLKFTNSGLEYFVTAGDHDLWDARNKTVDPLQNFREIFGDPNRLIERNGVKIVLVDNSDIYKGISAETWDFLNSKLQTPPHQNEFGAGQANSKLTFVMAHKTPFHPDSQHIMGEGSANVAKQAKMLLDTLINSNVSGFFSGDLHFFAQFKSPDGKLPITTVGAVGRDKNFQGPRFAIVKIFGDYTWEADDVEIR